MPLKLKDFSCVFQPNWWIVQYPDLPGLCLCNVEQTSCVQSIPKEIVPWVDSADRIIAFN